MWQYLRTCVCPCVSQTWEWPKTQLVITDWTWMFMHSILISFNSIPNLTMFIYMQLHVWLNPMWSNYFQKVHEHAMANLPSPRCSEYLEKSIYIYSYFLWISCGPCFYSWFCCFLSNRSNVDLNVHLKLVWQVPNAC
jgi:hypothetical protein